MKTIKWLIIACIVAIVGNFAGAYNAVTHGGSDRIYVEGAVKFVFVLVPFVVIWGLCKIFSSKKKV